MDKDFVISVRDNLKDMSEEVLGQAPDDIQGEVASCCIAIALEAIEDWIYDGKMFPSVIPIKPKREWFPMPADKEDNDVWEGPPWNRTKKKKKSIGERMPALERLRKERENSPNGNDEVDLSKRRLSDWTDYEKSMLAKGEKSGVVRAVVSQTRCSVKQARAYIDRLIEEGVLEFE